MGVQNRRTVRNSDGNAVELFYDNSFILGMDNAVYLEYKKSLNRLADYEDTGLSPAEVVALQADNARLHKLLCEIESVLIEDDRSDTNE